MAALFEPYSLWLADWETPALAAVPLVAVSKTRVVYASTSAKALGVKANSSLASALAKAPELEVVEASSPYLTASWERLVEELSGLTRTLETPSVGRVFMAAELPDAVQFAESYRVRVGLAESVEVATLAAFASSPGRVRVVTPAQQEGFLDALPLYALKGVGLSQRALDDLGWLGVTKAGELRRWKKAQASAYLGRAGKGVMPYLFGPYRTLLGRYTPAPRAALGVAFDEPQCEPAVLHPALERLCRDLALELGNKAASRLSVRVLCQSIEHRASRLSKTLLRRPGELYRLALLTLDDTKASPLGIEALTLEVSGLSRPSVQGGLWPRKERLEHAVAAVENRFPKAVLRLVEDDPYALSSDRRDRLVVRATGEEVGRETLDDPGERLNERKRAPLRA